MIKPYDASLYLELRRQYFVSRRKNIIRIVVNVVSISVELYLESNCNLRKIENENRKLAKDLAVPKGNPFIIRP